MLPAFYALFSSTGSGRSRSIQCVWISFFQCFIQTVLLISPVTLGKFLNVSGTKAAVAKPARTGVRRKVDSRSTHSPGWHGAIMVCIMV